MFKDKIYTIKYPLSDFSPSFFISKRELSHTSVKLMTFCFRFSLLRSFSVQFIKEEKQEVSPFPPFRLRNLFPLLHWVVFPFIPFFNFIPFHFYLFIHCPFSPHLASETKGSSAILKNEPFSKELIYFLFLFYYNLLWDLLLCSAVIHQTLLKCFHKNIQVPREICDLFSGVKKCYGVWIKLYHCRLILYLLCCIFLS